MFWNPWQDTRFKMLEVPIQLYLPTFLPAPLPPSHSKFSGLHSKYLWN